MCKTDCGIPGVLTWRWSTLLDINGEGEMKMKVYNIPPVPGEVVLKRVLVGEIVSVKVALRSVVT